MLSVCDPNKLAVGELTKLKQPDIKKQNKKRLPIERRKGHSVTTSGFGARLR